MKLLFDQNLSRFLVERVGSEFKGSLHVIQLGLDQATDREIWDWAGEHGFTIVSKDSDFHDLAASSVPPPKAIWLRVGNLSTNRIEHLLNENVDLMLEFELKPDASLLVIDWFDEPRG
ncbi:MAG: DUF5615 family PIN-like protein [Actinomycetes bacterium]